MSSRRELRAAGLALHNQGDVDTQTVSGATGTGTHGTGPDLGNLSTAITAVRIATADGEVVFASEDVQPGLYQAARLSLGALGIITAITFRASLRTTSTNGSGSKASTRAWRSSRERIEATRHYEFFWYPFRDLFEHKSSRSPTPSPTRSPTATANGSATHIVCSRASATTASTRWSTRCPPSAGPACFARSARCIHERYPGCSGRSSTARSRATTCGCRPTTGTRP